ncbi:CPBP family intramembrane glutamic endopeptidase [Bacteroides sp. 519]|uniref:CPBP family intramembrane glutamic endopeptidase n=1 Tax=Bacteroides sp. 519 TaxID=2302937 RepID=UPI0013D3F717|nr:type II CAAX endopeptidase family protein [Bacteroides sp. 519]NDV57692.1 CPBP family intramembrane metalloprotease [Bacteroides sp. 519]
MKTAIKLALIYYAFQLAGTFLGSFIGTTYSLLLKGSPEDIKSTTLSLSLLLGILFTTFYLFKCRYISKEKVTWSPISVIYLILTAVICLASITLLDFVLSYMQWLPNILEETFSTLQAGWLGILCIAILGPILEELLFRGAITKVLLQKYNPTKAIILSALIFGIIHINPIQVVSAFLMGLLLGWIYYKTASLIPCILIHIINNSLSVYLSLKYPDVETTKELFAGSEYYFIVAGALIIFAVAFLIMNKTTIKYPWKENNQTIN